MSRKDVIPEEQRQKASMRIFRMQLITPNRSHSIILCLLSASQIPNFPMSLSPVLVHNRLTQLYGEVSHLIPFVLVHDKLTQPCGEFDISRLEERIFITLRNFVQ
jgi:hypothetical protein